MLLLRYGMLAVLGRRFLEGRDAQQTILLGVLKRFLLISCKICMACLVCLVNINKQREHIKGTLVISKRDKSIASL
jgi:hypothetical protein